MNNVVIGFHAAFDMLPEVKNCTVIGQSVSSPTIDGTVRIGSGDVYLEICDGHARIVGAQCDAATIAVLSGLRHAGEVMRAAMAGDNDLRSVRD